MERLSPKDVFKLRLRSISIYPGKEEPEKRRKKCPYGCEKVRSEKTCRGLEKSSCDCGQEGGGGVGVWAAGEEAEIKGEESAKSQ